MRLTQFRHRSYAPAFFSGAKCSVAIPVRHVLFRDALQQASLEPAVRSIGYKPPADLPVASPPLSGIVVERDDGRVLLDVRGAPRADDGERDRVERELSSEGLRLVEITPAEVRCEPAFSNTRFVWSHERNRVPMNDRLRITHFLAEEGPHSIVDVEDRIRPAGDIVVSVCALACADVVEIDFAGRPLGPRTLVRCRR